MTRAVHRVDVPLVLLARAVMGGGDAAGLLRGAHEPGLTAAGRAAVEQALAVGWVRSVAHGGGARRERFASPGPGRVWERHPPPELTFTSQAVELLAWALRAPLGEAAAVCPLAPMQAWGDRALVFLLARRLADAGLHAALGERVFRSEGLVRLAWPGWVGGGEAEDTAAFAAALADQTLLVEAWCGWLADAVGAADRMEGPVVAHAAARRRAYAGWLRACEAAGRLDLALPLVDAAVQAMARPAPVAEVPDGAPLSERAALARAGTVLADLTLALAARVDALGGLAFFDDGYEAAQALRQRWSGLDRARGVAAARARSVAGV